MQSEKHYVMNFLKLVFFNNAFYIHFRDDNQLLGRLGEPSTDCAPFDKTTDKIPIAPCGAIANSLFSGN